MRTSRNKPRCKCGRPRRSHPNWDCEEFKPRLSHGTGNGHQQKRNKAREKNDG